MFFNRSNLAAFTLLLLTGSPLWAHPGHGVIETDSALHYLIEPAHGWWLLLLGSFVVGRWLFLSSRSVEAVRTKASKNRSREQ